MSENELKEQSGRGNSVAGMTEFSVVIVGDGGGGLDLLADSLSERGFEVHTASDAETGLSLVLSTDALAVFASNNLSNGTPWDLVEAVRGSEGGSDTFLCVASESLSEQEDDLVASLQICVLTADTAPKDVLNQLEASLTKRGITMPSPPESGKEASDEESKPETAGGSQPQLDGKGDPSAEFDDSQKSGTILIVEDAKILQVTFRMRFKHFGLEVETASNGREALEKLRLGPLPSLIICDLKMPLMDGFEFISILRDDPRSEAIPVIVCSASGDREAVIRALQAGANDYIVKPFTGETLLEKVKKALG